MNEKAFKAIESVVTEDGRAVNPATIELILTVVTTLITTCRKAGASKDKIYAEATAGAAPSRRKLQRELKAALGADEYKSLGGAKFANKIIAKAKTTPGKDLKAYISEITADVVPDKKKR